MIRITYNPETDILKIVLSDKTVFESDEEKPGVILDYDQDGAIIGLELLDASTRTNPQAMAFEIERKRA